MFKPVLVLLAALLLAGPACASVIIGATRVIYPAHSAEVTVQLVNRDPTPALLQVWVDEGDANADPQTLKVPFLVTPAMFRMEAGNGQALRLMHTGEPQAADRETLYWLNVLQIPPRGEEAGNSLQMAIRTRIKLIFRPDGLAGQAALAPAGVGWTVVRDGAQWFVEASNPSPFFVNLGAVSLEVAGGILDAGAGYVPPLGHMRFALQGNPGRGGTAQVSYIALDDYGAGRPGKVAVGVP